MRQIVDLCGLCKHFPFTPNQVYKKCHDKDYPLPHKKSGKMLLFDLERVWAWFDSLPGKDQTLTE